MSHNVAYLVPPFGGSLWRWQPVPADRPLTYEVFVQLAQQAGLDTSGPHLAELFPYVQSVLASLEPMRRLALAGKSRTWRFYPVRSRPIRSRARAIITGLRD